MKICTSCGKEWPDEYRLCPADGSSLRTSSAGTDLVDSVIADRYHITKKLGQGGMGAVYLAEHVKMGQTAAIKVITRALASDPAAIARFTREARNAARIKHPNVCMIHDFGETVDGLIYMAMEYIEGESLADLLNKEGRISVDRAGNILMQCCDALQAAHDLDIVHRDIKPENIMITKARDGTDIVKVVDFGIAKAVAGESGQTVTQTGFIVGTPDYMSPDQVSGEVLDGRSDIYSLAVVFFRMVTGALPFKTTTPQDALMARIGAKPAKLREALPSAGFSEKLEQVLDQALEQRRENRYETAIEFGHAVLDAVRGELAAAPPTVAAVAETRPLTTPQPVRTPSAAAPPSITTPETPQPVPGPAPRKRKGARVAALVGAVVVVGAAAAVWQLTSGGGANGGTTGPDTTAAGPTPVDSAEGEAAGGEGTVVARADTTGTVVISGLPQGGTILAAGQTLRSPFQLPAGRHEVQLRAPGYENKTITLDVVAGERMTVIYAARRIEQRPRPTPPPPQPRAARTVQVGQTVSGTLARTDPTIEGRHYQAWSLRAAAGQRLEITMRSSDLDSYLYLRGPGLAEPLEDDDGARSRNARIATTVSANGTFTVLASTYAQGATGPYTVTVALARGLTDMPRTGRILRIGTAATGTLTADGPTYEGRHVQLLELRVRPNTHVRIAMRSDDFDTFLYLIGPGLSDPLTNDDGGEGTNSEISATLQGGSYLIAAAGYDEDDIGSYRIAVSSR